MGITMVDTSIFGALNRATSAPAIAADLHQLVASGETLMVGASAHREILQTPNANTRDVQLRQINDFKMQIQREATAAEHSIGEDFVNRVVDKNGTKVNWKTAGIQVKDLPIASDVKVQMQRTPDQKVKLFTVERMATSKIAITRDFGIEFSERSRLIRDLGPSASPTLGIGVG